MSDHLPECDWLWKVHREFISRGETGDRCTVCDALRACETRVKKPCESYWTEAYLNALDAARDAVESLSPRYDGEWRVTYTDALAAIDALRGERYHSQRCQHCDHIRATHTLTAQGCIGHALPGRPGADCPCSEFEEGK